jgi:hypothetical protein
MKVRWPEFAVAVIPSRIASISLWSESSMMLLVAQSHRYHSAVTIFDLPESVTFASLMRTLLNRQPFFHYSGGVKKGVQRYANGPFHIFDILPYAILRIEAPVIL